MTADPYFADRIDVWYSRRYRGQLTAEVQITSEEKFLEVMEEIDEVLREEDIPIPGRPLVALRKLCNLVKEELRLVSDREPQPGRYTGDDLVIRMIRWFDERYGDRLTEWVDAGRVAILIRGDPWVFRLPLIYGGGRGVEFFCEHGKVSTLPTEPVGVPHGSPLPPAVTYNVLDAAVGLPDGFARSLTEAERKVILEGFLLGRLAFESLRKSERVGLVKSLRGDLNAAVEHMAGEVQPGLSQWASLQAAEKVLKAYIKDQGNPFRHIHNLRDLADRAESYGLARIGRNWLDAAQCSPGVRYEDPPVSVQDAITAHHASLRIVGHVAPQL